MKTKEKNNDLENKFEIANMKLTCETWEVSGNHTAENQIKNKNELWKSRKGRLDRGHFLGQCLHGDTNSQTLCNN